MLELKNLTVKYGDLTIVDNLSFTLKDNEWLMIVGPNGAGKSTVVNAVAQGIPYSGSVIYCGEDVGKMKPMRLAQKISLLSQTQNVTYSFTVGEVVRLGRYAYSKGIFGTASDDDSDSVKNALECTGLSEFEHQSVLTLSGGELQRTFLAQIFAQDPELLILDEPTNHLDLVYQKQIFELISEWLRQPGRSVISVVHDLSLAQAYGTQIMLMHKGRIVGSGDAKSVLSRENLTGVYSMD
ncbi:MAG: ABC transporter ATP-binding protein, partial [Clostridiales bacterium]|nr:ABC transporter ATP-binding protein [Clostridiales bacterium]